MAKPAFITRRSAGFAALAAAAAVVTGVAAPAEAAAGAPVNLAPPVVSGSPIVGQTLAASSGTWSGTTPMSFSYTWFRCDTTGHGCSIVSGARSQTYTVASADLGRTLVVRVIATNQAGSTAARSAPTGVVTEGVATAPASTSLPAVTGTAQAGQTLTASPGSWTGTTPLTYAYQWLRCDPAGAACAALAGATASSYAAGAADVGFTLRARVTATNTAGSATATSAQTAVVAASGTAPASTSLPAVTGTAQAGQTLTASPGSWTGTTPLTYAYQWLRCDPAGAACAALAGATASSYAAGAADVGFTLRARVTATNTAGSATATSAQTAVVAPASSSPALPSSGKSVVLVDQQFKCTGPVDLDLVKVTMHKAAAADAINLMSGCTGRIGRVEIDTWAADGIKVQFDGVHDVVVGGGYIRCYDLAGAVHQDGIQVMGGQRITFRNLEVNCTTAANAQFFVNGPNPPTDIVMESSFLGGGAPSTMRINQSIRSGARNTLVCPGRYFDIIFVSGGPQSPVNEGNTILPASDPRC